MTHRRAHSSNGPDRDVVPTQTFIVTGSATDDNGVKASTSRFATRRTGTSRTTAPPAPTTTRCAPSPDVIGATAATWSLEVTVPYEGVWRAEAIAVDTSGQSDLRGGTNEWLISATAVPPTVTVTAPVAMTPPTAAFPITIAPGSPITFSGTSSDDEGLKNVEISLRNNTTWSIRSPATARGASTTSPAGTGSRRVNIPRRILQLVLHDAVQPRPGQLQLLGAGDRRPRPVDVEHQPGPVDDQRPGRRRQSAEHDGRPRRERSRGCRRCISTWPARRPTTSESPRSRSAVRDRDSSRYLQDNGTLAAAFNTAHRGAVGPPTRLDDQLDAVARPAGAGRLRRDGDRLRHRRSAGHLDRPAPRRGTRRTRVTFLPSRPRTCSHLRTGRRFRRPQDHHQRPFRGRPADGSRSRWRSSTRSVST